MKLFNFYIDQQMMDDLKVEMKKYGFVTVAPFLRFILTRFLKDLKDNKQK